MNKEKLTITKIFRGNVTTKYGDKEKISIKATQRGDSWISTFKTKGTENWKEGDTVEAFVVEKNGYLNMSVEEPQADLQNILSRVTALEKVVFKDTKEVKPNDDDF